ncbi:ELMO domain [Trypanosoma melophagium]|uniref:ELMO domain n=1 Tax=Trypanosoma melophagium TaxID=715481 RepID=UPI003519E967|nr:ELMO domain [Trypanosoma melophagium]
MSWFSSQNIQSDVAMGFAIAGVVGVIAVIYHTSYTSPRTGGWIASLPSSLSSLASLLLPSSSSPLLPSRRRGRPVRLVISANQRPELATRQAITHITRGDITTLGELLYFFRGNNEKQILLDDIHYAYLQRILSSSLDLPPSTTNINSTPIINSSTSPEAVELLRRLTSCAAQATRLQTERATPFNSTNPSDTQLLRDLWRAAGLPPDDYAPRSPAWASLGFQGLDPTTDLRGGGVLALRQFVHFAQTHNEAFMEMMAFNKKALDAGEHYWYLLAVVSIHFTTQLLLQQDYKMDLPQLEVLYNTVRKQEEGEEKIQEKEKEVVCCDDGLDKVCSTTLKHSTPRSHESDRGNSDKMENKKRDSEKMRNQESDFEEGFFTLHHQLLLHFKKCWHRDLPHVMEYNSYIPSVYESFICESVNYANTEGTTKDIH